MYAFDNIRGDQFILTAEMMDKGIRASRESERKRIILPIHRSQNAQVQRMLNFLQPGTYIRPHMHPLDHATESLVLLRGKIRFYLFSESGNVVSAEVLSANSIECMVDIEPRLWHGFLVKEADTVLFESKCGPYNARADKTFARWAPEEGSTEAVSWMEKLENNE